MSELAAAIGRGRRPCIGLDLDNTIICYRRLFAEVAVLSGLVAPGFAGGKHELRTAIRALPDGERCWTRLQAEVYGERIMRARMMPGALDFVRRAVAASLPVVIVSHKTLRPAADPDGVDLREAARGWLEHNGFIAADALSADAVYFEATRADKIARIRALGCTLFVDDLIEVFEDPAFPREVERLLIAEDGAAAGDYQVVGSWRQVAEVVFAGQDHGG